MTNIRRNPEYQPTTVNDIATNDVIASRISELLERSLELECSRDGWNLDEEEVDELADVRNRLADYSIAQTIEQFGLDF